MTDVRSDYGTSTTKKVNEDIYNLLRELTEDNPGAKPKKVMRLYVKFTLALRPNLSHSQQPLVPGEVRLSRRREHPSRCRRC